MGIGSMVQFTARVAVFAAVAALLLQAACPMDFAGVTHLEAAAPANSGCHESAPATPSTPDPGHVCCAGNHSTDALLNAPNTTALPVVSQMLKIPAFDLTSPSRLFAATAGPSVGPPMPLALRI